MKAFSLAFLLPVLATVASAQIPSSAASVPGLTVTQHRWHLETHNPELDVDPFEGNNEQSEREREQRERAVREIALKQRNAQTPLPSSARASAPPQGSGQDSTIPSHIVEGGRASVEYIYEVKVSNTGAKAIRAFVWEYVLSDPDSRSEVGRHRFRSEVNVAPGKSQRLVGRSASPPSRVVNVMKTDKQLQGQYSEGVIIKRIEYADGSVWEEINK